MKHNVTIDRLRGFSVLVVVCMHYQLFLPNVLPGLHPMLENGYYGVTAFFCISGFLITKNMLERFGQVSRANLYAFYTMRVGRIIPTLALLLVLLSYLSTTALKEFNFPALLSLKGSLLSVATFRYNLYYQDGGYVMYVWAILWSLSIEEFFYLIYPLTAKVAASTAWLVVVLVELVVLAPLYRLGGFDKIYGYLGCFDSIALGALSALLAHRFSDRISSPKSWLLMIVGLITVTGTYATIALAEHYVMGLTLLASSTAIILFASQCVPFSRTQPRSYDPLAYLGKLSYEVYLFHLTIFALLSHVLLSPLLHWNLVLDFVVACFSVVAVSDLIHRFYAEPLNRWLRNRLLSLRTTRTAETASVHQALVSRRPFAKKFAPVFSSLVVLLPLVYAVVEIPPVSHLALTVFAATGSRYVKNFIGLPSIAIHNPQGVDGAGENVQYWIGPEATIELTDEIAPANVVRQFSLSFEVAPGPSNSDPARGLILRDALGSEQKFDFATKTTAHFDVSAHHGKNVYTLQVAYPTQANVVVPTDSRNLMVMATRFVLSKHSREPAAR